MLISNTLRKGTVEEEPWDTVVNNRKYRIRKFKPSVSASLILAKARSAIGQVRYNLIKYNCEHFVTEVLTGVPRSRQVVNAMVIGFIVSGVVYLNSQRR